MSDSGITREEAEAMGLIDHDEEARRHAAAVEELTRLRNEHEASSPASPSGNRHDGVEAGRLYVAGSTRDVERVQIVQEAARSRGWTITFDWTGDEGEIRTDGSWDSAPESGAAIAAREINACRTADLTILLFPPNGGGLGCWIEMGATLACGGEVWVVDPQRDSVFWQHPLVKRFASVGDAIAALARPVDIDAARTAVTEAARWVDTLFNAESRAGLRAALANLDALTTKGATT